MKRTPKRLKQEPLLEAMWQVQFEPPIDQPVGDLLFGVMYAALRASCPNITSHRLPTADIPLPLLQSEPRLRHAAKYRIEEPESPFLFQVGDRIVTVNCRKPYAGWPEFRKRIVSVTDIIEKSGLMPMPMRHSLRYVDMLALAPAPDLSALQFTLKVGRHEIRNLPLQMRLELRDEDVTHIVQIATPAEVTLTDGDHAASIIDIESYGHAAQLEWSTIRAEIDDLHDRSKALFFQQILTQEAVDLMQPEY